VEHVAGMGRRETCTILQSVDFMWKGHSSDLGIDGKIILKFALWKCFAEAEWNEIAQDMTRTVTNIWLI